MKKNTPCTAFGFYFRLIFILALAFTLQTCQEDDNQNAIPQKVNFTFDFQSSDNEGGRIRSTVDLPPGTYLLISLTKKTGESVLDHHQLELLKLGDGYITAPIDLARGTYTITDFMLVNNAEVLYATPKRGSLLAGAVRHALPYGFVVGANNVNNISMDVVDVNAKAPEDFGYASFGVSLKSGRFFQLSVFTLNNNAFKLTNAKASILKGVDTISTHVLQAKVNTLFFDQDTTELFTLVITKHGYGKYSREFSLASLRQELGNTPLSVTLKPVLTMKVKKSIFVGFSGQITNAFHVDWGDGSEETIQPSEMMLHHEYTDPLRLYEVQISGDLDNITHLDFGMRGPTEGPVSIDFSQTKNLTHLYLANTPIQTFNISGNKHLRYLDISDCISISSETMNTVINSLHQNVIANNVTDGDFSFIKDQGLQTIVGPPSQASFIKLQEMEASYNWYVTAAYFLHLEIVYLNDTLSGGLFPGAFTLHDGARLDFTVRRNNIMFQLYNNQGHLVNINSDNGYVAPGEKSYGDLLSRWEQDDYLGPLIGYNATANIIESDPQRQIQFSFQNGPQVIMPLFHVFGPMGDFPAGGEVTGEILPGLNFVLSNDPQVFHSADGFITATLAPAGN